MTTFEEMVIALEERGCICDVCKVQYMGCDGGVHGGPNGPIYPPCADRGFDGLLDEERLAIAYEELRETEGIK